MTERWRIQAFPRGRRDGRIQIEDMGDLDEVVICDREGKGWLHVERLSARLYLVTIGHMRLKAVLRDGAFYGLEDDEDWDPLETVPTDGERNGR